MSKSAQDILKTLNFMEQFSTDNCSLDLLTNPITNLVYQQIKNFNSEEIEKIRTPKTKQTLREVIISINNPFLFSALIEQNAFLKELSPESKWILNNTNQPNKIIYELIFQSEKKFIKENIYSSKSDYENINPNILFETLTKKNILSIELNHKLLLENFCDQYCQHNLNLFLDYLLTSQNYHNNQIIDVLIDRLALNNIDFSQKHISEKLNLRFLPLYENYKKKFFINGLDLKAVNKLLSKGFSFDEETYSFNEKNLFISVVTSQDSLLIRNILPFLKNSHSKQSQKEEEEIINSIEKTSLLRQEDIQLIKSLYHKTKLSNQLSNKTNIERQSKI